MAVFQSSALTVSAREPSGIRFYCSDCGLELFSLKSVFDIGKGSRSASSLFNLSQKLKFCSNCGRLDAILEAIQADDSNEESIRSTVSLTFGGVTISHEQLPQAIDALKEQNRLPQTYVMPIADVSQAAQLPEPQNKKLNKAKKKVGKQRPKAPVKPPEPTYSELLEVVGATVKAELKDGSTVNELRATVLKAHGAKGKGVLNQVVNRIVKLTGAGTSVKEWYGTITDEFGGDFRALVQAYYNRDASIFVGGQEAGGGGKVTVEGYENTVKLYSKSVGGHTDASTPPTKPPNAAPNGPPTSASKTESIPDAVSKQIRCTVPSDSLVLFLTSLGRECYYGDDPLGVALILAECWIEGGLSCVEFVTFWAANFLSSHVYRFVPDLDLDVRVCPEVVIIVGIGIGSALRSEDDVTVSVP